MKTIGENGECTHSWDEKTIGLPTAGGLIYSIPSTAFMKNPCTAQGHF